MRYKCNTEGCKNCSKLSQPPRNTLISLNGANCISCKDEQRLCKKNNINKYLKGFSYKDICKKFIEPSLAGYKGIVNPAALQYTLNPPLTVPPGQKGYNMVPDPNSYPVAPHYPPITNPLPLKGKNVLVVGAAKNLGKAIAQMFFDNGCKVVGTSRYPECYDEKYDYPLLKLDARFSEDVERFFKKLMRKYFTNNKIDILVNLPGIHTYGTLEESNGDDLTDILDTNVSTFQRVTYRALPFMKFSNHTRVISFGSVAGEFITPISGYTIGKHALQMWNDIHMAEALQRKAMGFSKYEPTFTLIEPSSNDINNILCVLENSFKTGTELAKNIEADISLQNEEIEKLTGQVNKLETPEKEQILEKLNSIIDTLDDIKIQVDDLIAQLI